MRVNATQTASGGCLISRHLHLVALHEWRLDDEVQIGPPHRHGRVPRTYEPAFAIFRRGIHVADYHQHSLSQRPPRLGRPEYLFRLSWASCDAARRRILTEWTATGVR